MSFTSFIKLLAIGFIFPQTVLASLPQGKSLTQTEAAERAGVVSNAAYTLSVDLLGEKEFSGTQTLDFNLSKNSGNLRIDFKDGGISKITANDAEIKNYTQDDQAIWIPSGSLKVGKNKITIDYTMPFSRSGIGLHRFVDSEDQSVYVYTHFEPNDASRFMPCFDQPDIKGTYVVDATVPASWSVISNKRESKVVPVGKNAKKWIFPQTWVMSSYLFEIAGGPFTVWSDKAGNIPLRLFARKTLAKYVPVDEWMRVTKQGMSFYGKFFAVPYPFEKYDQIVVPEFNAGAMENIAAVTFSERYLSRGKATSYQREKLANVILHEMAHMWFGDLVTMKWWNDLWLNESFATYMASKALADATVFKDAWTDFFASDKNWAYLSDQLPTTHPISTKINAVDEAFSNFDGITYGKGASVMKQLAYLIGEEDFKKGLQSYFKKYAFKNAELKDFIATLDEKSPQDLSKWSSTWLETMGVDTVSTELFCKDGVFEKLTLKIDSATPDRPRTHAFEVAFLNLENSALKVTHQATFKIKENKEYKKDGVRCPDVVFPNYNDYGYFKSHLDGGTLVNLKKDLSKTSNNFLRLMFWDSLWQMMRDQQISLQDYYEIFKKNIPQENSFQNAGRVLRTVSGGGYNTKNSVYFFYPTEKRNQLKQRQDLVHQVEDLYLGKLKKAAPGSDFQQLWMDSFITGAETAKGQQNLIKWLNGSLAFKGLTPDQDRRWSAIVKLCALGNPEGVKMMEAEKKKDKSSQAKISEIECLSAQPEAESKKAWWNKITDPKSELSLNEKRSAMRNFFAGDQKTFFAKEFAEPYFDVLKNSKNYSEEFVDDFTGRMGPDDCTNEHTVQMKEFILDNKKVSPIVIKELTNVIANNERCEKIRAMATVQMPAKD